MPSRPPDSPRITTAPARDDRDRAWLATLTVLYVEDDATTRALLARYLRRRVGRLVEAEDGAAGARRFLEDRPAIVITDIQMPGLDGLGMASAIRRIDPVVPILVTTAFEQVDYLRRAIEVGVDEYVTKPIDVDKLEAALLACARRLRAEALFAAEREAEVEGIRAHEREALGLLAGGMAHDFNNLLQAVIGNLSLAVPLATPGTELREILDEAAKAADLTVELGARLRTLADGGFAAFRTESLAPVLSAALAGALAGSRTTLRLDLPADLPDVAHDPELLRRAFAQLAQNAREAMIDAGQLSVQGELCAFGDGEAPRPLGAGRYVQLSFRDTGPGIAKEILPRVFDPYFSTKERGGVRGMGLGLALCAAIVRKHHGACTAASTPGEGAVFTVLLPTSPDPA